jgi:hypothetical protein
VVLFAKGQKNLLRTPVPYKRTKEGFGIKGGMQRIVKEVPNTQCIPVADLPRNGGVHYNTEGQIRLGRRFAEAYLKMVRK